METMKRRTKPLFLAIWAGLFVSLFPPAIQAEDSDADAMMRKGIHLFFAAKPAESVKAFDKVIELTPQTAPQLWQRGLALYYAENYQEGRKQFELHQTVNPHDVENAAWHFLCVARMDGVDAARKALIAIVGDTRIPMKEVHALFAGKGTVEDVLRAAENPGTSELEKRNQLCFAHLYLGLYHEALGKTEQAKSHMLKAATTYSMNNYMGETAQVHVKLRGWDK